MIKTNRSAKLQCVLTLAVLCLWGLFTPPVSASESAPGSTQLTLTTTGIGGITGNTLFTYAAIREAMPGFNIKVIITQAEGVTETSFLIEKNGKQIMIIEGEQQVTNVNIYSPEVTGPQGLRVGDTLAEVMNKVRLVTCVGGHDEMVQKVECSPAKDDDIFTYGFALKTPLPPLPDGKALTPDILPPTLIMSNIIWSSRALDKTASPIAAPKPVFALSAQQLLHQGIRIMSRAYRNDGSLNSSEAGKALYYYLEAAKKGSAEAYFRIGVLYENGAGVVKNPNGAVAYYERAASLGYIQGFSQIILLQDDHKNFAGAAQTFFNFYRANPAVAMQGIGNWSEDILRTIQNVLKTSGHYSGPIDGRLSSEVSNTAIAAYVGAKPAVRPAQTRPDPGGNPGDLTKKLQWQLKRVGCYDGSIDGKWGGGSRRALRNFNHWGGHNLPVGNPTSQALRAVTGKRRAVCGID